jgi:hypothetical protein
MEFSEEKILLIILLFVKTLSVLVDYLRGRRHDGDLKEMKGLIRSGSFK